MSAKLGLGSKAPDFNLPRDGGGTVSLADFKRQKLVLYFYPRADTPGCTVESKAFSDLSAAFRKAGAAVLGVSADPVKAQEAFKAKHGLVMPLASDETPPHAPRVWRVGREIHVWQEVHGDNPGHLPDRPRRAHRARLAQGEGRGPRRGGARRRQDAVAPWSIAASPGQMSTREAQRVGAADAGMRPANACGCYCWPYGLVARETLAEH